MLYIIHAFDERYGGSHGMEDWSIWDCENGIEVESIAWENSMNIINSFSCIYEELEAEIQNEIDDNDTITWTDEEIDELRSEFYNDNIYYDLYELDEEKIKNKSYEELEKELYSNFEEFLINYQKIDD